MVVLLFTLLLVFAGILTVLFVTCIGVGVVFVIAVDCCVTALRCT